MCFQTWRKTHLVNLQTDTGAVKENKQIQVHFISVECNKIHGYVLLTYFTCRRRKIMYNKQRNVVKKIKTNTNNI